LMCDYCQMRLMETIFHCFYHYPKAQIAWRFELFVLYLTLKIAPINGF
jgi:hypothetical protein